jgi:hypothetical protein
MYEASKTPVLEVVGRASELIQASLGDAGDGGVQGHSKIQLPPQLEAER